MRDVFPVFVEVKLFFHLDSTKVFVLFLNKQKEKTKTWWLRVCEARRRPNGLFIHSIHKKYHVTVTFGNIYVMMEKNQLTPMGEFIVQLEQDEPFPIEFGCGFKPLIINCYQFIPL